MLDREKIIKKYIDDNFSSKEISKIRHKYRELAELLKIWMEQWDK